MLITISISTSTPNSFQKATILNRKASKLKKSMEKRKHLRIINILKKFIIVTTITKPILDLKMNLTIDELLTSAPVIKK